MGDCRAPWCGMRESILSPPSPVEYPGEHPHSLWLENSLLIAGLMHFCRFYCSALSQILGEEGRCRGVKVASSEKENVGGRRNCVRQGVTKTPRREAGRGAEQGDREGRLCCAGEAVEAGRAGVERS